MTTPNTIDWRRMERFLACVILTTTPLIISQTTVDSFLLPKYVWLALLTSVWIGLNVAQTDTASNCPSPLDKPIACLLAVSLLSLLIGYQTPLQWRALGNLFMFVVLFYAFRRCWTIGLSAKMILGIIALVSVAVSVYGLLQDYGIDFTRLQGGKGDWRFKVVATLGNPNFLAGFLAISLPCLLGYVIRPIKRFTFLTAIELLIVYIVILLITACLTVTFSVGAAIGLVGAIVMGILSSFYLYRTVQLLKIRTFILIIVMGTATGWYMLDNPYNSHGGSLYKEAKASPAWFSGMGARLFNWKTTRLMINENPVCGIGFGNYLTVHEHYQGLNYSIQGNAHDRSYVIPVDQPHFQLLETASECGPLGVLVLFWLFWVWNQAALRTIREEKQNLWFAWGSYLGVWVAIIHSFSSFPFHLPASSLMVVVLASYHARSYAKQQYHSSFYRWLKRLVLLIMAVHCIASIMQFYGNKYLRLGYESQGYNSVHFLETARRYDPFSHQIHYTLGIRYASLGWYERAIESLNKAITLQEDLNAHELLCQIYLDRNEINKAIEEKQRVVELNPVYPGHHRELAQLLRKTGQVEKAQIHEKKAKRLESQLQE